ncbi:MAG: hypothetical protein AAF479_14155, partial [Pseudomonadota bacterium]
ISSVYRNGSCDGDPSPAEDRYRRVQAQAAVQDIALIRLDDHRLGEYEAHFLRRITAELSGVQA